MTTMAAAGNPAPRASTEANALHSGPATLGAAFRYFLGQSSPRVILGLATVAVAARVALGHFSWLDLVPGVVVWAGWPFLEWVIHAFILHAKATGPTALIFNSPVAVKHRAHHRQPFHLPILFFPAISLVFSVPLVAGLLAVTLPLPLAASALAFVLVMLLRYEWVHFLTHTRYVPQGRWYRTMWRNHRLHHCKNEHYWMGVSTTLGDRALGTFPEPNAVPLSPTCRTLGVVAVGDVPQD